MQPTAINPLLSSSNTLPSSASVNALPNSTTMALLRNQHLLTSPLQEVKSSSRKISYESKTNLDDLDLDALVERARLCLSKHDQIDLDGIKRFCEDLKQTCENLRIQNSHYSKTHEQVFCQKVIVELAKLTKKEVSAVLTLPVPLQEIASKLDRLKDVFIGMVDLTQVQNLFGGRLAFHCLPHSLGVALGGAEIYRGTRYEFAAFSAGAAHDLVMRYLKSPYEEQAKSDDIKNRGKVFIDKIFQGVAQGGAVHVFTADVGIIKAFKGVCEQKRNPGSREGCSEYDSLSQLLQEKKVVYEHLFSGLKTTHLEVALLLEQLEKEKEPFLRISILKTIPRLLFSPPNCGKKLGTIANAGVLPDPMEIVDLKKESPQLAERLIALLDRVCLSTISNYSKAVKDIEQFRDCYLADAVDPQKENGLSFKLPSFLHSLRKFFADAMPGYEDPALTLSAHAGEVLPLLTQEFKSAPPDVLKYLYTQVMHCGVPASDLGALFTKDCVTEAVRNESVALMMEENPYDADIFFQVHEKLKKTEKLGLEDPKIHEMMKTEDGRRQLGITIDEYAAVIKFMSIILFFIQDQKSFARGRLQVIQIQLFLPMKALREAMREKALFSQTEKEDLDRVVENFSEKFCGVDGKLRDVVQPAFDEFLIECKDPATCCKNIFQAGGNRWGKDFLSHPTHYGFTLSENHAAKIVDQGYLEEQGVSILAQSLITTE